MIEERDQCVYYLFPGTGGQALAMNGVPSIEVDLQLMLHTWILIVSIFRVTLKMEDICLVLRKTKKELRIAQKR